MNIGILSIENESYIAGTNYQRNLVRALVQYAPNTSISIFVQNGSAISPNDDPPNIKRIALPERSRLPKPLNRAIRKLCGYDLNLRFDLATIRGGDVQVLFPGYFRVGKGIALMGWIPDFQHIHLPEMFTDGLLKARERELRDGIRRATRMILSSQDAFHDFCAFAPRYVYKARVMNFVAAIPDQIYQTDPESVMDKYKLPERFFYLPNQFWKHKNHRIVFDGLASLKKRGIRPFLVCTGLEHDHRNPAYFTELRKIISDADLEDRIAFLGIVPTHDVYQLIRQAVCVINPSLFEGWSTTVEETKSIGKRILLSDLAVHREQNAPEAVYFNPQDVGDVAHKLMDIWANAAAGPNLALESRARNEMSARMRNYAATFVSIAEEAVQANNSSKTIS
jgi:glycosyltransferase involved in cell wall biosynthesis